MHVKKYQKKKRNNLNKANYQPLNRKKTQKNRNSKNQTKIEAKSLNSLKQTQHTNQANSQSTKLRE